MNFVADTEVFKFPDRAARNRVLVERLRRGGRSSDRGQRGRRDGSAAGTRLEVLRQGRPPGHGSFFCCMPMLKSLVCFSVETKMIRVKGKKIASPDKQLGTLGCKQPRWQHERDTLSYGEKTQHPGPITPSTIDQVPFWSPGARIDEGMRTIRLLSSATFSPLSRLFIACGTLEA